jgi:pimeloyl-ACP methyl ester carboxylesterase
MGERASTGVLHGGLPFNRIGAGPPLVVLQGLTLANQALSRFDAWFALAPYRPLARHRSVYVVNRRPGQPRGTTLSEMAAECADMIRTEFEPPVDVIGLSSGGSVAFYLAAEQPEVVRRLVLQDCACRQTAVSRAWGREVARLAEAGRWRAIGELMIREVQPDNAFGHALAKVFAPLIALGAPNDPTDVITLLEAEDGLDFTDRLSQIRARTLVACGELDPFSGAELALETAAGIPNGRAVVYAGQRHGVRGKAFGRDLRAFLGHAHDDVNSAQTLDKH